MDQQSLITAISILLLLLIGVLSIIIQNHRRNQILLQALNESSRSKVTLQPGGSSRYKLAVFVSAPSPFRTLHAELGQPTPVSFLFGWLERGDRRAGHLCLRGNLSERPSEELVWTHGLPPGRAIARSPDSALWELRRLDLVEGDFAVRGINTNALEHAFFELQARFGAFLQHVLVQADAEYEVEIDLLAGRLNAEDIPALITTVRSLGRAALR
ncbi:MAG: hypothetical protein U0175_37070 [Caldilineaceae bacterium]